MRNIHVAFVLILGLLYNCIGEDIINDTISEEIRFLNPVESISASETYKLNVRFFNNIGEEEMVTINWSSDNNSVASVNANGLVTGISEGNANIKAQATVNSKIVENTIPINITPDISGPKSEEIVFLNPKANIAVSETHQYNVKFYNGSGEEEVTDITWSSSNPAKVIVDVNGLVTGVSAGTATIKAETVINNKTIENTTSITITEAEENTNLKSGVIKTTSSYNLKGSFTLSEIKNSNNLLLVIESDYEASTSLPGLYVYLSNNPNSIGSALEIAAVTTFSGAHTYTINNKGINDYAYVLYWCKPFGVKVGEGEINN